MMGAIVGDIVGSVYEWHNIKTKDFPLFRDDCFFTDDTVMTCAVAEAVMNGGERDDFIDAMKKYGRMYPDAGYGGRFGSWIFSDNREPYNSYGNGSAMRVSPCAWIMDCGFCTRTGMWPSNGRARVQLSAEVTHNHPEGVKGTMATADAIRNAISLGGDSDTLAAITGSIAEAAYGIPDWIKGEAYSYLDEPLKDVLRRWKKFISINIFILTSERVQTGTAATPSKPKHKKEGFRQNIKIY